MNDAFERYAGKMRVYERLCRWRFHLYETGLIHSCGPRLSMKEVESLWKGLFGRFEATVDALQFAHAVDSCDGWPQDFTLREKLLTVKLFSNRMGECSFKTLTRSCFMHFPVITIKAKQWLVERNLVQNDRRDIEADADYADGGEDGMKLESSGLEKDASASNAMALGRAQKLSDSRSKRTIPRHGNRISVKDAVMDGERRGVNKTQITEDLNGADNEGVDVTYSGIAGAAKSNQRSAKAAAHAKGAEKLLQGGPSNHWEMTGNTKKKGAGTSFTILNKKQPPGLLAMKQDTLSRARKHVDPRRAEADLARSVVYQAEGLKKMDLFNSGYTGSAELQAITPLLWPEIDVKKAMAKMLNQFSTERLAIPAEEITLSCEPDYASKRTHKPSSVKTGTSKGAVGTQGGSGMYSSVAEKSSGNADVTVDGTGLGGFSGENLNGNNAMNPDVRGKYGRGATGSDLKTEGAKSNTWAPTEGTHMRGNRNVRQSAKQWVDEAAELLDAVAGGAKSTGTRSAGVYREGYHEAEDPNLSPISECSESNLRSNSSNSSYSSNATLSNSPDLDEEQELSYHDEVQKRKEMLKRQLLMDDTMSVTAAEDDIEEQYHLDSRANLNPLWREEGKHAAGEEAQTDTDCENYADDFFALRADYYADKNASPYAPEFMEEFVHPEAKSIHDRSKRGAPGSTGAHRGIVKQSRHGLSTYAKVPGGSDGSHNSSPVGDRQNNLVPQHQSRLTERSPDLTYDATNNFGELQSASQKSQTKRATGDAVIGHPRHQHLAQPKQNVIRRPLSEGPWNTTIIIACCEWFDRALVAEKYLKNPEFQKLCPEMFRD